MVVDGAMGIGKRLPKGDCVCRRLRRATRSLWEHSHRGAERIAGNLQPMAKDSVMSKMGTFRGYSHRIWCMGSRAGSLSKGHRN